MSNKVVLTVFSIAVLSIVVLSAVFLSGCTQKTKELTGGESTDTALSTTLSIRQQAIDGCIALCERALLSEEDLGTGPCLSNEVVEDWVCDVAHSPRQTVDNYAENQCSAYRAGDASHFVEVDPDCKFIKAV